MDWIKDHKGIVIVAVVVVLGLLIAIATGTINLSGKREQPTEATPPATTQ